MCAGVSTRSSCAGEQKANVVMNVDSNRGSGFASGWLGLEALRTTKSLAWRPP